MLYQKAEKFINETFWTLSHDGSSKFNATEEIKRKLEKDNKEKDPDYYSNREGIVHASSIGSRCLRGIMLEMLGAKTDSEIEARKLGVFAAGNLFEEYLINSLGDKIVGRQREYNYKYKTLTIVGRSDFLMNDNGTMRIGECKSVHSDSFWYREKEGNMVAWHNLIQLQIYLWLERELFGNEWNAELIYISKDDCTVSGHAIKYNPDIIEQIVKPTLDILNEAFEKRDANICPIPDSVIFSDEKNQFQTNWLAKYCLFHKQCAGENWEVETKLEVASKNKQLKDSLKKVGVGEIKVVE